MNPRLLARSCAGTLLEAGVPDAAFEAELLVRHAGGLDRARFFGGAEVTGEALLPLLERRVQREPFAYIAGRREFYGLDFEVSSATLIPRPETELLVDLALEALRQAPGATLVDVGTGSGCMAVAIAGKRSDGGRTVGIDVSKGALAIARRNATRHGVNVDLIRADLAAGVEPVRSVVVANLPYVPTGDLGGLEPEVRDWEPRLALDGGVDGLRHIRRLVGDCGRRLRPSLIALEVGDGQAARVAKLLHDEGAVAVRIHQDLAGIDRVVSGSWCDGEPAAE